MKNNSRVYNLIGGIALLMYAGYAIFGLIKGIIANDMDFPSFKTLESSIQYQS
jgi:hypothetical protein